MKSLLTAILDSYVPFRHAIWPSHPQGAPRFRGTRSRPPVEALESRLLLSAATKLVFGTEPSDGFAGTALSPAITVKIEDASNAVVDTDSSLVTLTIASGSAGGMTGIVSVHAVHGIATFSHLLFTKVSQYKITASDGALASDTSTLFNINAPPHAASLVFAQEPTANPTGPNITPPVVVDVKDQYGNVFTKGIEVVTLTVFSGPAGGKLLGTFRTIAIHGVATFHNLNVTKGGTYVLAATAGALTVNSTSFNMGGPRVATTLVFLQQPMDVTAGAHMTSPVKVEVKDQFGNVLTTDHSLVKLTIHSGPTLTGMLVAPVINGVATFSNVVLDKSGAYTLQAADGALTPVISNSFNVSAGAFVTAKFAQIPATGLPHSNGSSNTFTVVVDLLDRFGNIATSNNSLQGTLSEFMAPHGVPALNVQATAVNGVVTFSNVSLPAAGSYILKASHGNAFILSKLFTLI